MIGRNLLLCLSAAALALAVAAPAGSATYNVTGGGAQFAVGGGLPLPAQTFPSPSQTGVGTHFPPLLIPPTSNATVMQTGPSPHTMKVPIGVFQRVPTGPSYVGVANNNPRVWQVRTNLQFTVPGFTHPGGATTGSNTFAAGGRTGAKTATFPGIPAGAKAQYSKSLNQFGGPARSRIQTQSPVLLWVHADTRQAPCKHIALGGANPDCAAQLVYQRPPEPAAIGASVGFSTTSPGGPPPMSPNVVGVNVTSGGFILSETSLVMSGVATNMGSSAGFPWTTGRLRLSQPSALGTPEVFTITGQDGRTAGNGVGTLSLVAGALSDRTMSGPNANRGWARFVLPEPGAALGAATAIAMLALCHARRRARRFRAAGWRPRQDSNLRRTV